MQDHSPKIAATAGRAVRYEVQGRLPSSPPVCVLSFRAFLPNAPRCCAYELEDVICELDDAELMVAPVRPSPGRTGRLTRILSRHTSWEISPKRRLLPLHIRRRYDLTFVAIQSPSHLTHLKSIRGWRQNSRVAVCYLEEIWRHWIESYTTPASPVHVLKEFDYVFVNCAGSVEALRSVIGRPVYYIPPGVDALRFCPLADRRSIDVYYMGRRSNVTHQALMNLSDQGRLYYLFDSMAGSQVRDVQQHRQLLANTLKNTRYFIVQKAKADCDDHTAGQQELGFRYFEGAAAGTVMIGSSPAVAAFQQNFDWPDAVVPMSYDCEEVGELIADLDSQPERLARIRRDNVVNALTRHDWCYRWNRILETVGLSPPRASASRLERLEALADTIDMRYRGGAIPKNVTRSAVSEA